MPNPLAIATQGKGVFPMLARARKIAHSYGLSAQKIDRALTTLTTALQDFNAQATLPVTASALARNRTPAQQVMRQGVELAVHGYTHIDYTQLALTQQQAHFRRALQLFAHCGIAPTGFRAPYLRWNADTLQALRESGFRYDSSQALAWDVVGPGPHDSYVHVLDFYAAQFAAQHPALPRLDNDLVRIPYCLPDDEALLERLHLAPGRAMAEVWLALLDRIYAAGELFTLGLHPERAHLCLEALRAVLARARSLSPAVWITSLQDVATWYRRLGETTFSVQPNSGTELTVTVSPPSGAVVLARQVAVAAPQAAWLPGYVQVLADAFRIPGPQRPWIGLAPDSSAALQTFLRHQGFLVELSAQPHLFSYYFAHQTFQPEDERPLLAQIETGSQPLLRLGRWPEGARAALVVTGDVDAFTLWDYGLRMVNR